MRDVIPDPFTPAKRLTAVKSASPEERARAFLIERGQNPTPAAIAERVRAEDEADQRAARRKARRKAAADLLKSTIEYAVARCGPAAAAYVAEHLDVLGEAPTWRELARELDWPPSAVDGIIRGLAGAGWLAYGPGPRSLRPGPRHQETPQNRVPVDQSARRRDTRDTISAGQYT